jgi:sulfur-oxidizing protein SoxX
MKISVITAIAAGVLASTAYAQEVLPTAVSFTDGAVAQSLSGVAGDPANGRIIIGDNGQGNCVACHVVSEMSDVPFQGNIGPALDGTGTRWSEAELRGIVVNAKVMFEGTMMPSFYRTDGFIRPGNVYTGKAADETFGPLLTAQQVEDVVAYLATLTE